VTRLLHLTFKYSDSISYTAFSAKKLAVHSHWQN